MRISEKSVKTQRMMVEQKLKNWLGLRSQGPPKSGWLKAIRGALGISSYQLARRLGIAQSNVIILERREKEGKAQLESIQKAAEAMNCKLIYAIVPIDEYDGLEAILMTRAKKLAKKTLKEVEHSMKLEKQGSKLSKEAIEGLARELVASLDSRIWEVS